MAIYHFHAQYISRGKGRSAVAASAYRSGERIYNDYDGNRHDYTNKSDVVYTRILTPAHAPEWTNNRSILWNEVEKIEKAKNASLAKEINLALPTELDREQQIKLMCEYTHENFVTSGMVADIAIHDKGDGNPHAHILLTNRPFNERGEWTQKAQKEYILDEKGEKIKLPSGEYKSRRVDLTDWNSKQALEKWRENWAKTTNRYLELASSKERIDHRSYQEQGIEKAPTIHLGVSAHQMEQKGIQTDRGNINRQIVEDNRKIQQLKQQEKDLLQEIQEYEQKPTQEKPAQSIKTELAKTPTIKQLKEQEQIIYKEITQLNQIKRQISDKYWDKACSLYLDAKYKQEEISLKEKLQEQQNRVGEYNKKSFFTRAAKDIFSNTSSSLNKEYQEIIFAQKDLQERKEQEKQQLQFNSYTQEAKLVKEYTYELAKKDKPENIQTLGKIEERSKELQIERLKIAKEIKLLQKDLPRSVKKEKSKNKDMDFSL